MNIIVCFDAENIKKKKYVYDEFDKCFKKGHILENSTNLLRISQDSFKSIFEEKEMPLHMQKIFFICILNNSILLDIKKILSQEIECKEVVAGYPIKINFKGNYIECSSHYTNFDLYNGYLVSKEYMNSHFELICENPIMAKKYLECLKEIISLNYQFDGVTKYLIKK